MTAAACAGILAVAGVIAVMKVATFEWADRRDWWGEMRAKANLG